MSKSFEVCFYCKSTSMIFGSCALKWQPPKVVASAVQGNYPLPGKLHNLGSLWKNISMELMTTDVLKGLPPIVNYSIIIIGSMNICCTPAWQFCWMWTNLAKKQPQQSRQQQWKGGQEERENSEKENQQIMSKARKGIKNSENDNRQKHCTP